MQDNHGVYTNCEKCKQVTDDKTKFSKTERHPNPKNIKISLEISESLSNIFFKIC